jgi:hypothetical protein
MGAWNADVVARQFQLVLQAIQIARGIEPKNTPAAVPAAGPSTGASGRVRQHSPRRN